MIHAGGAHEARRLRAVLRVGIFLCPEGWRTGPAHGRCWRPAASSTAPSWGWPKTDLKYVHRVFQRLPTWELSASAWQPVTVDGLNGGGVPRCSRTGAMTALFFSSVGYIYDKTHTKMIPELGGLSKIMPMASFVFHHRRARRDRRFPAWPAFGPSSLVFHRLFPGLSGAGDPAGHTAPGW